MRAATMFLALLLACGQGAGVATGAAGSPASQPQYHYTVDFTAPCVVAEQCVELPGMAITCQQGQ